MQKQRKQVAALLAFMLLLLVPIQTFGLEFNDVPITASYHKAVDKLSNAGVIQGRDDGSFAPNERTTRAEFCAFLARANGYNANYYTPKELPFTDVAPDHWAVPYISFCYENGYINGMLDGTFCPEDYVTDAQTVKMVVCSSGAGDESLSKIGPKWYSGYLNIAQKYDLLKDTQTSVVAIKNDEAAKRAFVAQVVYNSMLKGGNFESSAQDAVIIKDPATEKAPIPEKKTEQIVEEIVEPNEEDLALYKPEPEEEILVEEEEIIDDEEDIPVESIQTPVKVDGKPLVVIDAGHNYSITDTGAVGNGLREQDITFYISEKIKPKLEKNGVQVILTRNHLKENVAPTSVSASLKRRAEIANEAGADLFISVHCNAGGGTGVETYYTKGSEISKKLATLIQKQVLKEIDLKDRGVKSATFSVLRNTEMPAALLETGFIDCLTDSMLLRDPAYQDRYARAVAKAVCEYFGIKYEE